METTLRLDIEAYPMDVKVYMTVETNFGRISGVFSYPPALDDMLGDAIQRNYKSLLTELYDTHASREGSKFPGEEDSNKWLEDNGITVVQRSKSVNRGL